MKKIVHLLLVIFSVGILSSCFGDLDTLPLDPNELVSDNVYADPANYKGILAKCYAALILTGQQGGDGGDNDLGAFNEGYGGYVRILFYLQSLTTDETLMPSQTNGLRECTTDTWTSTTAVLQGCYNRLYHTIGYCNNFLAETTPGKLEQRGVANDPEIVNNLPGYREEARFIRAYAYHMLCDLFGAVPFATEETRIGSMPEQKSRLEIFKYVEEELLDVMTKLKDPQQNEYARVDKAAAWFLLTRHYLNSEVFIGTPQYDKAYTYAKKLIDESGYRLADEHRFNFLADNDTSPEIIWPLVQDGVNAQSSAGSNFFVKAFMDGEMPEYFDTGVGTKGWGNVRILPEFVDKFDPADQLFDRTDPWGHNKMDKRAQFFTINHTKYPVAADGTFSTTFSEGYAFIKWRNVRSDGQPASDETYVDIDFPLFRLADAYLMAAEAIMRQSGGTPTNEALEYVNEVRARAYQSGKYGSGTQGLISVSELNYDFLLDERAREMCTELTRRTDLIRFGKFTKGYNWHWKGYTATGKDIDNKYVLFPIPESDISANTNLEQNPDYK